MKTKTNSFLLAILLMGSIVTPAIHALPSKITAALSSLLLSSILFKTRKSVKDFKPRFSIDKVKSVNSITTTDYWKNIWYLYYDYVVGQPKKEKAKLKSKDGEITIDLNDEEIEGFGIFNFLDGYIKPTTDAVNQIGCFAVGLRFLMNPDSISTRF